MRKFSIDEIEIIELGWPNYTREESWENMCAYYAPELNEWILTNRWNEWEGLE